MKYFLIIILLITGCSTQYGYNIDSIFDSVSSIVEEANAAFSKAEAKILVVNPDKIVRPDPDPLKCPCKGTGLIKHGDNHVTKCPYHDKSTAILKR